MLVHTLTSSELLVLALHFLSLYLLARGFEMCRAVTLSKSTAHLLGVAVHVRLQCMLDLQIEIR